MRADDEPAGTRRWYLAATPQATLPWLIRLRCATAGIEALTVVVVWFFPAWNLPLDHLTSLLIVAALTNVGIAVWLARGHSIPAPAATVAMLIEMSLLTGLLELTGGPLNPFTAIYAVQVLLAAVTLGAVWAWLLGGFAGVCYGVLVYWHLHELAPSHHRLNDSPTHLLIIWCSAAVMAELLRYVAIRVSDALEWREQVLEMMRTRAARTERLAALTTLAAGAAHELSTPLATIAVAACELERAAAASGTVPDLVEEAHLIRTEVERCRGILDQMSGRAGGAAADEPEWLQMNELLGDVRGRFAPALANRLRLADQLIEPWRDHSAITVIVATCRDVVWSARTPRGIHAHLQPPRLIAQFKIGLKSMPLNR
jgi:two-component system sensor histidine kinase RegB